VVNSTIVNFIRIYI